MIRKDIISNGDPTPGQLAGFKAYARIDGSSQDATLTELLTTAMLAVQDMADESLLVCEIQVEDTEVQGGAVRLFETVDEVLEVIADGKQTGDWKRTGNRLEVVGNCVKVRYRTRAYAGTAARLMPVAYRYAAALEEGLDERTLNRILASC